MPIDYRYGAGSNIGGSPIIQLDLATSAYPGSNPAVTPSGQKIRLGMTVQAYDFGASDYGEAEFKYVKFTGAVVAGDVVVLNAQGKACVQAASGSAATGRGLVGIAMASHPNAGTTPDFGWVMIRGVHTFVNTATLAAQTVGTTMYLSAVAGQISTAAVATYRADGITLRTTATTAPATEGNFMELNWPVVSGNG